MNIHACSFASPGFLRQQALQSAAFSDVGFQKSQIHACGTSILGEDFKILFPQACESNRFGYFSFKPYFLAKTLQSIPVGDILFYLDVNDCPRPGLIEYIGHKFENHCELQLLATGTNYLNTQHMSWYHRQNLSAELRAGSWLNFQPEAGALVIRNSQQAINLLRVWFELNVLQTHELLRRPDNLSRHDQETLYLLSRMNRFIKIESWLRYKITGEGLRKYIDWEVFRNE